MNNPEIISELIKAEALRLGFDGCGISRAERLNDEALNLREWINNGFHADMSYMENHFEKRVDPGKLVNGAISVISVTLNYFPEKVQADPEAPVISKYAYGQDYHDVIRKKLNNLLTFINDTITPVNGRAFVDSAPVLDRAWAARSGLGWIGKNSMLISPKKGSFLFIGSLIVDIPLIYDKPIHDFCGDCTRCINSCPTKAIIAPKVIDSNKCISWLTIENKGEIKPEYKNLFQNRVFGCDICQDVCPWNKKSIPHSTQEFSPFEGLLEMTREEWHKMDEVTYKRFFRNSAVKRTKYQGLKRNLDFLK